MSFPNQDLTIHLQHTEPRAECEYCDHLLNSWPPLDWSEKDLEQYAETMQRESAVRKQAA